VLHKPILGICLGMQLMTDYSEEGNSKGFGWVNSTTKKIAPNNTKAFKVPHVGWNLIRCSGNSDLLSGIPLDQEPFYFCNSYAIASVQSQVKFSTYKYDKNYVAHFEDNNIFGVQFHPEKSHSWGNALLQNFLKLKN
jgi:glutamine amidotransferase